MKQSLFTKPKIIIPIVAVIAIVVGIFAYRSVGKAPTVSVPASDTTTAAYTLNPTTNSVDLAFPKAGRVATVAVKVGDHVTKGETLATLQAQDAAGAVTQAKGALELAQAQYASMDVQYANAKKQQDVLVQNAYNTLLSNGLTAVPSVQDDSHIPTITGTYSCDKVGSYTIIPYSSGATSGFSFTYDGLEKGSGIVTFNTPQPLGACGLYIQFAPGFESATKWTISIPNTISPTYVSNKNAYDAAVAMRDQVLTQYAANLGQNGSSSANVAKAAVDTAEGVYQAALGAYQTNVITSPIDGTVTFIDSDLKSGQSVTQNKTVISITLK